MATLDRPRVDFLTPEDLVREVLRGSVRIPQFQRIFRWEATDIVKLFDSVLRGYPVGNLLLWRRPAPEQRLQIGPIAIDAAATDSALWVVDGQQRITSLVGALTEAHRATDSRFRVHLDLDSGEFHTAGPRQHPPPSWLPVSLIMDTATLLRWMRDNAEWLTEDQLALADQAAKAIREYQIPTYVVTSEDEAPLLEIFTRMNTMGKQLTKAEVFQALHSSSGGDGVADLTALGRTSAEMGFGSMDERLMLRSVLAFRGGDIFREDFAQEFASVDDQTQTFRDVAAALHDVIDFLRRDGGIPHVRLMPYSHIVPVLVRFVRLHGSPEGRAATLLRRWIWRGAVAGTRSGGMSVVDIRNQVAAVGEKDAVGAASGLLGLVRPFPDFRAELDKVHFRHAMAKLNALGMLSAGPRDLASGQPVEVAVLLDGGAVWRPVFGGQTGTDTVSNRIVVGSGTPQSIQQVLAMAGPEVALSHLIDEQAQMLIMGGRRSEFLQHRGRAIAAAIERHVADMAEWGARDGQAIADMIRVASQ